MHDLVLFFSSLNIDVWDNVFAVASGLTSIGIFIFGTINKILKKKIAKTELEAYLSESDLNILKNFIDTSGQFEDPCNTNAISPEVFTLMPYFIKEVFNKNNGGRYFAILADSGMGKTTFLRKLYIKYRSKLHQNKIIKYYPLSYTRVLEEIESISLEERVKTILLLDALDEDKFAIENSVSGLDSIVSSTEGYYKVIISCRTQFFKKESEEPKYAKQISSNTQVKLTTFEKIYLSPLSKKQIKKYLNRLFLFDFIKSKKAFVIVLKCSDLMTRPMLLGYMEDLLEMKVDWSELRLCDIYELLINRWCNREAIVGLSESRLKQFNVDVARYMFNNNTFTIENFAIEELCTNDERSKINPSFGRSRSLLNRSPEGKYKFTHKSIYEYLISRLAYEEPELRPNLLEKIESGTISEEFYKYFGLLSIIEQDFSMNYLYFENIDFNEFCLKFELLYYKENEFMETPIQNKIKRLDFRNKDLTGSKFLNCNLSNSGFENTVLNSVEFTNCKLINCSFQNTFLKNVIMKSVDIAYSEFRRTKLNNISIINSCLGSTAFDHVNLSKAVFTQTRIDHTSFIDTELNGVKMALIKLNSCNFIRSALTDALLENCKLTSTTLETVDMLNVRMSDVTVEDTNFIVINLENSSMLRFNSHRSMFSQTDIKNTKIIDSFFGLTTFFQFNLVDSLFNNVDMPTTKFCNGLIRNVTYENNSPSTAEFVNVRFANGSAKCIDSTS